MKGTGPLSAPGGCSGLAHVHTHLNTDQRPDIQAALIQILTSGSEFESLILEKYFRMEFSEYEHVWGNLCFFFSTLSKHLFI